MPPKASGRGKGRKRTADAAPASAPAAAKPAVESDAAANASEGDDGAVVGEQPAAKRTRTAKSKRNLNDNLAAAASVTGVAAEVAADLELRAEWEKFDDPLLRAWILEFDEQARRAPAVSLSTSRSDLLNLLVAQSERYRPPAPEAYWIKELLACRARVFPICPPPTFAPSSSPAASSMRRVGTAST